MSDQQDNMPQHDEHPPAPMHEPKKPEPTEAEVMAEAEAKQQAESAKAAEQEAKDNPVPAAVAFYPRIEAARFEHRNQGHDDTMQLIDELYAAVVAAEEARG